MFAQIVDFFLFGWGRVSFSSLDERGDGLVICAVRCVG